MKATLDIDLRKTDNYTLNLDAKTRGFLGKVAPWSGTFRSEGWVLKSGAYQPQKHISTASWRGEVDVKEYLYNKNGSFKSLRITDEHSDAELRDVGKELTDGTIDALTATLEVLKAYNTTGKCEGTSEVFDGKRRFKQIFVDKGEVDLKRSKFNLYEGKARECVVEVVPVAGKWHEKPRGWMSIQEQGRDRGLLPTVWIAKISEKGPAVPVKIRVKTAYGTLFMHLAEYKNADKFMVAERRTVEEDE